MIKKILPVLFFIGLLQTTFAQEELSLQLIPGLYQSSKTNPAMVPADRLVVGLSSFYASYFHNAGSIGNLVNVDGDVGQLDIDHLLSNVAKTNFLKSNLEFETVNVHFRLSEKFAINFNHAIKSNVYLKYNNTLPKLFWEGNAQYIGQEVSFGPDQQSFAYNEFGVGAAITAGKLTIGARAKWLTGIGDVSTDRTDASLFTDDDIYQLTLNTDYRINTSTFDEILLFDTLSGYGAEYGFDELFSFENFTTENSGVAFDLGLQLDVTDRLSVGASFIDWGKINWSKEVKNYHSQGSTTYEGLDFGGVLTGEDVSLSSAVDTIETIFEFAESSREYSTSLAPKIYVNAMYVINDRWSVGGLYYNEFFRGESFSAMAVSAQASLIKNLMIGASYSIRNSTYDNIGLNAVYRFGPVQVYAVTDNILAAIQPYESKNVNLRAGLNIIF